MSASVRLYLPASLILTDKTRRQNCVYCGRSGVSVYLRIRNERAIKLEHYGKYSMMNIDVKYEILGALCEFALPSVSYKLIPNQMKLRRLISMKPTSLLIYETISKIANCIKTRCQLRLELILNETRQFLPSGLDETFQLFTVSSIEI